MFFLRLLLLISISVFYLSCSKDDIKKSVINEVNIEAQFSEAYQEGIKSLKSGDALFAAKKFNEAETLFPQSNWAPKSAIMAGYSYYSQDYYLDAIAELDRFVRVYPYHEDLDYVYYLLGLSWYEQIVDEKKDLQTIIKAKEKFTFLINNYPNTEYALDAEFKIDLINDILASKEMYVGRYYFEKKKWIPAINRFRAVVDEYDSTIYIEEALHRLVEIYYILGLVEESKKYANLLGYNYQSSEWYENTYSLFNNKYKKIKKNKISKDKKRKSSVLKKFKSLFEWDE